MALVARNTKTQERVCILDYPDPRNQLKQDEMVCQLCTGAMIIKAGMIKQHHFAHKHICTSDFESHPESEEHLFFKKILSEQLGEHISEYTKAKPQLEYPIKEVKRVADIVFAFPNGWLVAHEIQLASITNEELEKRTNDYREAGVDVIWWLGNNANTPANREWSRKYLGGCFLLNYDRATEVLALKKSV